ncbi:hypothetical protein GLYMA_14G145200v4 [Glycine max]|uniref:RNA polymerase sigma-70 region 2 domain-containing protein n=2 Tax=Glycine subgen. Soja TaxID=1462606 RepID=I1MA01_SOYBN|nr:hypothetical protein GLYMA_14G145200v4 [Glycine max]RZB68912.1 RNA polymerase sigma factor sigC [Glycine soja]
MGVGFALNPRLRYCVLFFTNNIFLSLKKRMEELLNLQLESGKLVSTPRGYLCPQHFMRREKSYKMLLSQENKGKRSLSSVNKMIDNTQMHFGEVSTHFCLLMDNLFVLEETFADYEALRLEKAIILQLEKLGALKLFNVCLSRSLGTSPVSDYADKVNDYKDKVVVQSRKRKENKTRRENLLPRQFHPSFSASVVKRVPNTKNKRIIVAKREAEISKGLKVLAELEKIRTAIEEDTKQVASLSNGAEASGVDEKVLQQLLHHGYYCRDELIQSTHSLVLYLARKYMGMGIALDDLLQAGYVGVLQGAGRFDSSRGYKFSTYVQYWIRKSILRVVARYARGIVIPPLNRAINQIQKARKAMKCMHKKCPDDYEIAKMTGLSLDKIKSASNCLRIVASLDQKVGNHLGVEYMVRL